MEKIIEELIIKGDFFEAKKSLDSIDQEQLRIILLNLGDDNNICAYSFICFLILDCKTIEYHSLASEILIHCFPHLGGYAAALYHVRRYLQLCPDDVDMLEMLLFFHNVPEKLVSREEAIQVAGEILKKNPDSSHAKAIFSEEKL
ncbi:hypothetical protein JST56_01995 [Candidatus Dependentiae bacterium]|jgi:hypothetical protein|nr:hypothetical protein [Candidatus Dependentiae bacterium]